MALSLASLNRATALKSPMMLIYGIEGIGKTTFASRAPSPAVIFTEPGRGIIPHDILPSMKFDDDGREVTTTYSEVLEALSAFMAPHDYKTLVVDSVDWLERLIWVQVCHDTGKTSIEQIDYGKGYVYAMNYWTWYLTAIKKLRDEFGMAIVMIGHHDVKNFKDPEHDAYDRYTLKLHKTASAYLREACDIVGFANYKIYTTTEELGFRQKHKRGIGTGERLLYVQERPAFQAKNRFDMPEVVPLDWPTVAGFIPIFSQQQAS